MQSTIRLHRVLRATPERVYRAFIDADAMAKWLPPHGFTGKVHQMDARVGGTYKMSFKNFNTGNSHSFGGKFLELVPSERLRYTDVFDDPNLPGEMQTTVVLKKRADSTAGNASGNKNASKSARAQKQTSIEPARTARVRACA